MLDPGAVTDELRARVRAELPEVEEIRDPELRAGRRGVALALAASSFGGIAEIEPSNVKREYAEARQPDRSHPRRHPARHAHRRRDEHADAHPEGRPRPGRRRRALPRRRQAVGVRPGEPQALGACSACCRPAVGAPSGLWRARVLHRRAARRWRIARRRTPARASCWCARSRTRSCTTPTTRLGGMPGRLLLVPESIAELKVRH